MTFIKKLEDLILKDYHQPLEEDFENILDTFKIYGSYLNQVSSKEEGIIEDLAECLWEYSINVRDYNDYSNGERYMTFPKRDNKTTPGKIRIKQDINILKKARDLLQYVSSENYRIMQGSIPNNSAHKEFKAPTPPIEWQTNKKGKRKYKDINEYYFANYQDKEIALKAYNQTINLYEDVKKDIFAKKYRVEKDIFNTYYFLTSLIQDLENQKFYLFEKSEYYQPKKPSKKNIKMFLYYLRKEFSLIGVSLDEKILIDNL